MKKNSNETNTLKKFFNSPYTFIFAVMLGMVLAVGTSVWATSVGTNVTVTGNLTTVNATLTGTLTTSSTSASSTIGYALGVATTTPGTTFSVVGSGYFTAGLGVGIATTTAGAFEATGPGEVAGAFNVGGAAKFNSTVTVGSSGTAVNSILHGFCSFGPIVAAQTIAATSTGTVACTTEAPTGHAAGDRVWLTASTTVSGVSTTSGSIMYTGIASSSAAGRIQAMIWNGTGVVWSVTTSTWQYLIVK